MLPANSSSRKETQAQLGISRGSRAIPILLLFMTIILFVVYALPADNNGFATKLGFPEGAALTFWGVIEALNDSEVNKRLMSTLSEQGFLVVGKEYVVPGLKIYLEQLVHNIGAITESALSNLWQLTLFSLLPGFAGLIYRRNFGRWFLMSFTILLAIKASGVFGSVTSAEPMPGSGEIFFFLLSQLVVLILALRLQRHATSLSRIPPNIYNWGLISLLTIVGIACWQGWGPGMGAATNSAGQVMETNTDTNAIPRAGDASSAITPAQTEKPVAKVPDKEASIRSWVLSFFGRDRSWIWSFLGTGFTGWVFKWEFILIGLPLVYTLLRNSSSWSARNQKNIIICLDGTSNTPDQIEMGFAAQTNVFKLFKMLKADKQGGYVPVGQFDASLCKKYDGRQIAFYYAGVGNKYDSDPILQTLGMATGMGAAEIVERAYLDLVRVYQPGDRIFITGFSRGAAIARLLARAIDARGAPRSMWTLKLFGKHRTIWTSSKKKPMLITVLGCWDTVGAFGVAKTIAGINFQKLNAFKDLTIPDNVSQAYHMVALDEQRDSFDPTLMDPDPIRPERIVEVWFAGDHANIGGGWATDRLSDVTLDFLLSRVSSGYAITKEQRPGADESWGLYLTAKKCKKADVEDRDGSEYDGVAAVDPDPLGQVRQWFSNLYTYRPRTLPLHAVISETVFERMTKSMPIYAPQALFDLNDALDEKRDLIDEKVGKLVETNSLDETERKNIIGFKEKLRLSRWPKYWASVVATRKPLSVEQVLSNMDSVAAVSLEPAETPPQTLPQELLEAKSS
ncbi:MAG: DUF2235 domain-containing protein [Hyphomicrobiaceae bacterium]|nr:DUF2235 domain-containing protein [Hyphomicrobiaceae bacterium]